MEAIVTDDAIEVTQEDEVFAQALSLLNEAGEEPLDHNQKITDAIRLLTAAYIPEINNYHFTMGNSETGVIGMACQIIGATKEKAVLRLQKLLRNHAGDALELHIAQDDLEPDEYITVYLSPENAGHEHIDRQHTVG